MKNLFSILLAASILTSAVFSAPTMMPSFDSIAESDVEASRDSVESTVNTEASKPSLAPVIDGIAEEDSHEKPSNHSDDDAFLMFDIFEGGDGSEEAPYEIATVTQLEYFSKMINSGDADYIACHYKLVADIDLGGTTWTPIGFYTKDLEFSCAFQGSFDGDGHTISNFTVSDSETRYMGFFGQTYNAQIKNLTLDNVTINADRTASEDAAAYAGVLAGRIVSEGIGGKSTIENCHVTNSSVSLACNTDTFAGGFIGFSLAGAYSEINIFNVSSTSDVNVVNKATEDKVSDTSYYSAEGAGLIAYFGALTNGTMSLRNAHSSGNVTVDCSSSAHVNAFGGGLIAQTATRIAKQVGGVAYISSCHASGNVKVDGQLSVFAGGFAGNAGATKNMFISDCYASGDVSSSSKFKYCAPGGFVGQIDFDSYSDSMGKPFSSNYASGDAVDTLLASGKSLESYAGGFVGYSFAPIFKDCYILESQFVSGKEIFENTDEAKGLVIISNEASLTPEGYPAFDFDNVWQMDAAADYPYPTLRPILGVVVFYSEGKYFDETYFGEDGKAYAPELEPEKEDTVELDYFFSHWSLTEDGEAFDLENTLITQNTVLYAVFGSEKQKYDISFISNGKNFVDTEKIEYGSTVTVPASNPKKPETQRYRYEFDYWSLSENGSEVDFDTFTVTGNTTFHAVFTEIDKTAWNGAVADSFKEGLGSASMPYIISSAEEFALMAELVNQGNSAYIGSYFALGADINLGYNNWTPVGTEEYPFNAHFDGNGYSVNRFKIRTGKYMGLFGYVKNATIENLYLSDFEIDSDGYTSSEKMYVGGLAGYVDSYRSTTVIDSVYVSASRFEVNAEVNALYVGNIAGYVNSKEAGRSLISNSYATSDITASNNSSVGTTYAGGIAGYMYTYASTLSKASTCYYVGSIASYGTIKSCAGGLTGAIYSYGSAYSPSVPTDGSLSNEASDFDIMLENCFAAASVSATAKTESKSAAYASAVSGEISQYAGINKVFYQRGLAVISSGTVNYHGTSASAATLETKNFISSNVGFDFVNTWTYVGSGKYPVLKTMYSDKPLLRLNNVEYEDGTLNASVTAYARSSNYTVIVAVYDERNRLVASKRTKLTASEEANEFDVSFDNLRSAYRVKISAIDSLSFAPLFSPKEWYL